MIVEVDVVHHGVGVHDDDGVLLIVEVVLDAEVHVDIFYENNTRNSFYRNSYGSAQNN